MPIIATSGPSASVVGIPMGPDLKMDPYFIESQHRTYRNLTVFTGQTAFMECRVRNLGAKQVNVIYQYKILYSRRLYRIGHMLLMVEFAYSLFRYGKNVTKEIWS